VVFTACPCITCEWSLLLTTSVIIALKSLYGGWVVLIVGFGAWFPKAMVSVYMCLFLCLDLVFWIVTKYVVHYRL
jgi:hypothetical protein